MGKNNKRCNLINTLQDFSGQTEYRAAANTVSYDDLLFGIERCNSGTLRAILAHHRIIIDSKTKQSDMTTSILTHISDGHCWKDSGAEQEHQACEDIKQTIDTAGVSEID